MKYILTAEDWGGEFPSKWDPKSKGRAIDSFFRREYESTSYEKESYDMDRIYPNTRIRFHEFKSTSTGSISVSRMELEHAERKYHREQWDTLYWVCLQGKTRDEFTLEYFILYSAIFAKNLFRPSKRGKDGDVYFWMDFAHEHRWES